MARILFVCLVLCQGYCAGAQTTVNYFDQDWQPVARKKHATFYRMVTHQDSLYRVEDFYVTGKPFRTGYRSSMDPESYIYREGHYVFYDLDGHKMREGDYRKGCRNGLWQYYLPGSGRLKSTNNYHMDTLEGISGRYDEGTGEATELSLYQHGREVKEWDINGTDTTLTLYSYQDTNHVETEYYANGKPRRKTTYLGQHKDKSYCYSEDGTEVTCPQPKPEDTAGSNYRYVEQMPQSPYELNRFLVKNIHYPADARKLGIEGRVLVRFTVDEDGVISDVRLKRGIGGGCDEEALRVISILPPWQPGYQNGMAVRVYYTLPISFKLK